jgi:hypothetical protein
VEEGNIRGEVDDLGFGQGIAPLALVMPALVAGFNVLWHKLSKAWMAGTQASEATPSFERLCPAMTGQ